MKNISLYQAIIIQALKDFTEGTHNITWTGESVKGRKLLKGRSWASFTLTFMKNGEISFRARNTKKRFNQIQNKEELYSILSGFECL